MNITSTSVIAFFFVLFLVLLQAIFSFWSFRIYYNLDKTSRVLLTFKSRLLEDQILCNLNYSKKIDSFLTKQWNILIFFCLLLSCLISFFFYIGLYKLLFFFILCLLLLSFLVHLFIDFCSLYIYYNKDDGFLLNFDPVVRDFYLIKIILNLSSNGITLVGIFFSLSLIL